MIKAKRAPADNAYGPISTRRAADITGLCLFFVGAACLLWLTLHEDAVLATGVDSLLRLFAGTGAYAIPIIMMFIGAMFLVGFDRMSFSHSSYGSLLLFTSYVTWRHIAVVGGSFLTAPETLDSRLPNAGGIFGGVFGTIFLKLCGPVVSYVFLTLMVCVALVLIFDKPFKEILRHILRPAAVGYGVAKQGVAAVKDKSAERRQQKAVAAIDGRKPRQIVGGSSDGENLPVPIKKRPGLLGLFGGDEAAGTSAEELRRSVAAEEQLGRTAVVEAKPIRKKAVSTEPVEVEPLTPNTDAPTDFKLPPLALLKEAGSQPKRGAQELNDKIQILEQTLMEHNISANVVEIAAGPTVTRYEIQLGPGIKVSKIVSMADNLAMALAAIDVRVEAPIPGKSAIGIEVPNSHAGLVTLREVLDTNECRGAASKLVFALGKDVSGACKYADLTKMPHLLVAGSTNSGKSVCLNVLIASLLYRATPRELQFLMIDPKRVELSLWDGIPHLMHPVVKDVKQAAGIFRAALKEMERRYDLFSKIGTRNIDGYNQRMVQDERDDDKLPYLVIVVDELADLMMQAAAEIETSICRLAQLARATGIHLVIATQRPSVDVITGLIKANISSRIAFAVSSQVDSRTILDMNGAERLIGRGDMLFLPIDASKPMRIQGCYLSEQETLELVKYLKEQERPNYTISVVDSSSSFSGNSGGGEDIGADDEFFEPAVKLVVTNGQASTSMLQRRFKIGYTRAARLVDLMEERGIVGALEGAKPRDILISKDEVDQMFRTGLTMDFREREEV